MLIQLDFNKIKNTFIHPFKILYSMSQKSTISIVSRVAILGLTILGKNKAYLFSISTTVLLVENNENGM